MDDAGNDAVKRAMSLQRQLQLKKKCDLPTKIKSQSNDFKLNGMQMNIYVLDGFSLHLHCFTRLIISGFFWNTQSEFFFHSFATSRKIRPRWLGWTKTNETFNNNSAQRNANEITLYQSIQIHARTPAQAHQEAY